MFCDFGGFNVGLEVGSSESVGRSNEENREYIENSEEVWCKFKFRTWLKLSAE